MSRQSIRLSAQGDKGRSVMAAKYVLKKSSNGQFRFVLKAANGETIATSELYTTKSAAKDGIDAVRRNASTQEEADETES